MKQKLYELAEYMLVNKESTFAALSNVKSVGEAADYAYDIWMDKRPANVPDYILKCYLDFKVQWVIQLADSL